MQECPFNYWSPKQELQKNHRDVSDNSVLPHLSLISVIFQQELTWIVNIAFG